MSCEGIVGGVSELVWALRDIWRSLGASVSCEGIVGGASED